MIGNVQASSVRCPSCGTECPAEARFCGGCGQSVPVAAPAPAPNIALSSPKPAGERPRNRAWVELLRRVLAATLLLVGLAAIGYRPEYAKRAETVDWSSDYRARFDPRRPITQHVDNELHRGMYAVEGPEWHALLEQVRAGQKVDETNRRAFFEQRHPLLAGRSGIAVIQEGPERHYLRITNEHLGSISSGSTIPRQLVTPFLWYGLSITLAALAVYVLFRRRSDPASARYKWWVALLIDCFGLVLIGLLAFVAGRGAGRDPVGAAVICAVVFAVAQALLVPAAYFAGLRAKPLAEGVHVSTLFGSREFAYADISSAVVQREAQSPLIGILLIVLGLTNGFSVILGLVLLFKKDLRLTLRRSDGKTFRIWVRSANGVYDGLIPALEARGVQVARFA